MKSAIRPTLYKLAHPGRPNFACPICGYRGPFKDKRISKSPDLVRLHSKCLNCHANERHRMLYLVFREIFSHPPVAESKVLHIAPEACLSSHLSRYFEVYHTADLLKPNVDFNEDIQKMSFPDASYDAVVVSRVLTIPPDIEASVSELRRILKPGGIAVIAEIHSHAKTREFGKMINDRSREVGMDMLDLYRRHFDKVDVLLSDRYDDAHQLANLMMLDGEPHDGYPEEIRIKAAGFKDLVAICHA